MYCVFFVFVFHTFLGRRKITVFAFNVVLKRNIINFTFQQSRMRVWKGKITTTKTTTIPYIIIEFYIVYTLYGVYIWLFHPIHSISMRISILVLNCHMQSLVAWQTVSMVFIQCWNPQRKHSNILDCALTKLQLFFTLKPVFSLALRIVKQIYYT